MPIVAIVDPDTIDWDNQKVHLKKDAAPQPADVIETEKRKNDILPRTQERFKKEIRKMLDEHKEKNIQLYAAHIAHQRRRLMLEKIRRLKLFIAASEARIAQREGATK